LLLRRHGQRVALAIVLACSAIFQAVYGFREMATHQFAIWGWKNTLIFDRATGTFVNPNHFANYAAIIAPFGAFFLAMAWHDASPPKARLLYRLLKMIERRILPVVFGSITVGSCLVAILISKSRGALLALFAGAAVGLAAVTGRRIARTSLFLLAAVIAVVGIAFYLGREHTSMSRFEPTAQDAQTLGGRRSGVETAVAIWKRYPLFGSGLGTFAELAPMTQPDDFDRVVNHAHDDYLEILATTGIVGLAAFLVPLLIGLVLYVRSAFRVPSTSWRRRAFHGAALAGIVTAVVHGFFDFSFFIPANAVTLAAIAGAAVATRSETAALRGSSFEDSQA
jgi:O-antigen ligase